MHIQKTHSAGLVFALLVAALSVVSTTTAQEAAPYNPAPVVPPPDSESEYPPYDGPASPAGVPAGTTNAAALDFDAILDNNTRIPPDSHGAVSSSHVMTMLNSEVRVQTRSGTNIFGPVLLDAWWADSGLQQYTFDPRLIHDPYADRWVATAMQAAGSSRTNSHVLLAVSETSNPTDNWHFIAIEVDSNDDLWADYPSMGFNKNWIAVHVNMYTVGANDFDSGRLYLFNRTNVYAGGSNYSVIQLDGSAGSVIVPAMTYDTEINELYALQTLDGNFTNNATGSSFGSVRLYSVLGTPDAPSFATNGYYKAGKWANSSPSVNLLPQLNTEVKIHPGDTRMQSVVYRNGYIWGTHTVFTPYNAPTVSGIRWWQLKIGANPKSGTIEDPNRVKFNAFPSIAVNRFNDVVIGFSTFATDRYASAAFAFRPSGSEIFSKDPIIIKDGEGIYYKTLGTGRNRWGDYSATIVDPANDADFWTIQEYAGTHENNGLSDGDGRWATRWANILVDVPENDDFVDAFLLSGTSGSTNGTLFRATQESGEPDHLNFSTGSVWYKWTPSTDGVAVFDTLGSTNLVLDTLLAVYTGTNVTSLSTEATNDNGGGVRGQGRSLVSFSATADTTYYVAVDAKHEAGEEASAIVLGWRYFDAPTFTLNPEDQYGIASNAVVFTAEAVGVPDPAYQWKLDGTSIPGATYQNYTNSNPAMEAAGNYTVVASNYGGSTTSDTAVLTMYESATAVLGVPTTSGNEVEFTVTGVPTYTYVVRASTDLTTWNPIYTNVSPFTYSYTITTNYPERFFKVVYE